MNVNSTERLFWKKYPFKVLVMVIRTENKWKPNHFCITKEQWAEIRSWIDDRFTKENGNLKNIRIRKEGTTSIFFSLEEDYNDFVRKFKSTILEVWQPISKKHESILHTERNILVRKTLFHGEFRYAIRLKYLKRADNIVIDSWIQDYLSKNTHYLCCGDRFKTIFVNTENDVLIIRLALHEYINVVEHIKLITELETQDES